MISSPTVVAGNDKEQLKIIKPLKDIEDNTHTYAGYLDEILSYPMAKESLIIPAVTYIKGVNVELNDESGDIVIPAAPLNKKYIILNEKNSMTWKFEVEEAGLYNIGLTYCPLPGREDDLQIAMELDGQILFDELQTLALHRNWANSGKSRIDPQGNEFAPEQVQCYRWSTQFMQDAGGEYNDPYLFALSEGAHTITIKSQLGTYAITELNICVPKALKSYMEIRAADKSAGYTDYMGEQIEIQGEDANLKSTRSLVALSDMSSPDVDPAFVRHGRLNYIGGNNWQLPGEALTWNIDIKQAGHYTLYFKYRQSYLINGETYRRLLVDGQPIFEEAESIAFPYTTGWKVQPLSDADGEACRIYLSPGLHTLSMVVTMGPMADINRKLESVVYQLGEVYRQIVMITGDSPDANRDYNLFGQIPNLKENLTKYSVELENIARKLEDISGKRGGTGAAILRNMSATMNRMMDFFYQAQQYKGDFYNNYCSVSSWLSEMKKMPLDIDKLMLVSPEKMAETQYANIPEKIAFSVKRFLLSFLSDYGKGSAGANVEDTVTVWVYWGRDQARILNYLAQDSFTAKNNIGVNLKIVNASLVQAILSGRGPDCALSMSRSQPVNLAMRSALYDLTNFEDFEAVTKRFMPTALIPYTYNKGIYALPDTQQFYMLFYRTDIFAQMGLTVPKSWEEFIYIVTVLQRNNMNVGIPYTSISDTSTTDAGVGALSLFPTILQQMRGSLYKEDLSGTNLSSSKAIQAFIFWTDLYTKYSLPKTYDFYNRFRTGELPMAITSYSQYSLLSVAAPEINNKWAMTEVPGFLQEDESINNTVTGGGGGSVILKNSKNKQAAWEFLKWWTSADTQYRYSTNLESVLGIAARTQTANIEAFGRMSWKGDGLEKLMKQWENVKELPEVPGGYFTARVIDQAFWNTVNQNTNPRETIISWSKTADEEIARKRKEYGLK